MEINTHERQKICPSCQLTFFCYTENCWCSKLPQVMPIPAQPGGWIRYSLGGNEDCLCPDCLKIAIDRKLNTVT